MHVKALFIGCLTLCSGARTLAQNQLPVLSNVTARADTRLRQVTLSYNVFDAEEDHVRVTFQVSSDGGRTYRTDTRTARGDLGDAVATGTGKKIYWAYPDSIGALHDYKVKLVVDDGYRVDVGAVVEQVDSLRLKEQFEQIVGKRNFRSKAGRKHMEAVKDTVHTRFAAAGLETYRQKLLYRRYDKGENVIGVKPGQAGDSAVFIVSAHMDAVASSLGADDNGSGVAGMLEAMRVLSKYNFRHTIKFVGFDLEEEGWIGSKQFVAWDVEEHERIEGVFNYDMIAYYSDKPGSQAVPGGFETIYPEVVKAVAADAYRGNFVVCTANEASDTLALAFAHNAARYVPGLKTVRLTAYNNGHFAGNLAASDHVPFWLAGYKAVHIGDGGESRNRNLDTRRDVPALLNFTFASQIVKATVATLACLAELEHSSMTITDISVLADSAKK